MMMMTGLTIKWTIHALSHCIDDQENEDSDDSDAHDKTSKDDQDRIDDQIGHSRKAALIRKAIFPPGVLIPLAAALPIR